MLFRKFLRVLADIEVGGIALVVLRLVQRDVVALLVGLADRDVADLLEAEIHRVGLPHLDALAQDRVQRLGHVEVAHAAAGEAGGAGAGAGLVDQHDVGAFALAALGQVLGEVIGGRHAVHAGADHDELRAVRQRAHVMQRHHRRIDRLAVLGRRHRPFAERDRTGSGWSGLGPARTIWFLRRVRSVPVDLGRCFTWIPGRRNALDGLL